MFLQKITLTNYKNLSAAEYQFGLRINCFIGNNGVGKSNILDAIYHLAFGKSYFNPTVIQNIQFGKDFFVIEGKFQKSGRSEKITCSLKRGQKKVIKRNNKIYDKIIEHIGLIHAVIISPADQDLIVEGSAIRRKFMDGVIGQTDSQFLRNLIDYNKILSQRNALLKCFARDQAFDENTLAIYNRQLVQLGNPIHDKRKTVIKMFVPVFENRYRSISGGSETVKINYLSHLNADDFLQRLENSLAKDKSFQHTTVGIHKDDLDFLLNDEPIKRFGSQGQQKSFLTALKLAQFDFLKTHTGVPPILLLDDVFDKLDQSRVSQIIQMVNDDYFGQIFITDTHKDRSLKALSGVKAGYEIFYIE